MADLPKSEQTAPMFTFRVSVSEGASVRCHGCGWTAKGRTPDKVYPLADAHVCPVDTYLVARNTLSEKWKHEETPEQVVAWVFEALDAAGDESIPRDAAAREEAEAMAGMVFADLADEGGADYGVTATHILRAALSTSQQGGGDDAAR